MLFRNQKKNLWIENIKTYNNQIENNCAKVLFLFSKIDSDNDFSTKSIIISLTHL